MKPKLLLHSCCGPCVIHVIEQLSQDYQVTVFYFNPNIHPRKEFLARRNEIIKYLEKINVKFIEGNYHTKRWFESTQGLEDEPERGQRCDVCFKFRLENVVQKAKELNFDAWASSLSISPHKDYQKIFKIGQSLAQQYDLEFVDKDWKKQDGFKHACQMSKEEGFYRQNYCGCVYSKRDHYET